MSRAVNNLARWSAVIKVCPLSSLLSVLCPKPTISESLSCVSFLSVRNSLIRFPKSPFMSKLFSITALVLLIISDS